MQLLAILAPAICVSLAGFGRKQGIRAPLSDCAEVSALRAENQRLRDVLKQATTLLLGAPETPLNKIGGGMTLSGNQREGVFQHVLPAERVARRGAPEKRGSLSWKHTWESAWVLGVRSRGTTGRA